jgi:hypothetical protein
MRRVALPSAVALLASVTAGCAAPRDAPPRDRASQAAAILEEVFRCEVRQLVPAREGGAERLCLSVRDESGLHDPSPEVLIALSRGQLVGEGTTCPPVGATRLVAGPIEWIADGEVRVRGENPRDGRGSAALLYRVVWSAGRWECLGPISQYDPL